MPLRALPVAASNAVPDARIEDDSYCDRRRRLWLRVWMLGYFVLLSSIQRRFPTTWQAFERIV